MHNAYEKYLELEARIDILESVIDDPKERVNKLSSKLASVIGNIATLEAAVDKLKQENIPATLENRLDSLHDRMNELEDNTNAELGDLDSDIEKLQDQVNKLSKEDL